MFDRQAHFALVVEVVEWEKLFFSDKIKIKK